MDSLLYGIKITNPMKAATMITDTYPAKRPLVIYHSNCADGFGAAWCFYDHSSEYEFHAGVYGQMPPNCLGRVVYLVDFSYKKEAVKHICQEAAFVYLLDHHATALNDLAPLSDPTSEEWQKNFHAVTDLNRSGAMIAWDFLHNNMGADFAVGHSDPCYNRPPLLLAHIQDRDLWKFKLPDTRNISAALFSYEYDFIQWDILMKGSATDLLKLSAAGAAIERKHHKDINELLKITKRLMKIGDHVVPVASLPYTLTSDAGAKMAREFEGGKRFAACYWDTAEDRIFSLRSGEDGMDVSLIAEQYGGGGHKSAAGFKVPRTHELAMR